MMRPIVMIILVVVTALGTSLAFRSGSAAEVDSSEKAPARFGLAVLSEPAPAMVFVDGEFVGQTHADRPLEIVIDQPKCQLRLSEAGFLDGIFEVDLEAGALTTVKTTLTAQKEPWSAPEHPIKIRVGQPLRGAIGPDGKGPVYVIDEPVGAPRMLVGLENRLKYVIKGPKGETIRPEMMSERPAGTPGEVFHECVLPGPGVYKLEFTGKPGPFSLRYVKGLPPLAETNDDRLKGRRQPPR